MLDTRNRELYTDDQKVVGRGHALESGKEKSLMVISQRQCQRAMSALAIVALTAVAGCSGTPSASVGQSNSSASGGVPTRAQAAKQVGKITLTELDQETSANGQ